MLTHFYALILGAVEGITEFLPISSTGHLILTSKLLGLTPTDFLKSFEIVIQFGAILAVVVLYFKTLTTSLETWKRIVVAFIPTGIIGLALYKVVKNLLGSNAVVLWSLAIGGLLIIIFEFLHKEKPDADDNLEKISYKKSFIIGLFQSIAIIPGVSRAAATIIGGLLLGLRRKTIVEFSFLLAVPTMAAATGLDLVKNANSFSSSQFSILAVGFVASFIVAILSVKLLLRFIQKHNFTSFGVYRILIAIAFWLLVL
ncbi:MAG: undecaprenyl-diphosphate phosphatase [Candidatus Paceibacterota bacterium]|jgi:undecaprenyl-diphosphatase